VYPDYVTSIAGFGVGIVVGMTGVGGGALMTPLLLLVFGVAPQTAVGTDLLFAAITKSVGAVSHSLKGTVDWIVVRRLLWGSIPASIVTLLLLHGKAVSKVEDTLIVNALGTALIVTSIATLFKAKLHDLGRRLRIGAPSEFKRVQPILTIVAGAFLGTMVTLTSIGAGALGAVMLTYLYPLRLTPAKLVGTDIAHAIPLALVAGAGYFAMGSIDFTLLGWLLLGSVPGILVGAHLGSIVPDRYLRRMIALVLLFVGARLLR
jgi:uncharacterized membrane protein YfcA